MAQKQHKKRQEEKAKQLGPASPKQEMMISNDAQILIMGGAAGSGKSYLLNMIPLRYVDCPHWDGIIFRRTTVELKGQGKHHTARWV
ncbi:PhoH family protein [Candidatus Pacearchaeota archaeon]|nr:PhoH family protein [Candidatus Pacearchaeota archaeon]